MIMEKHMAKRKHFTNLENYTSFIILVMLIIMDYIKNFMKMERKFYFIQMETLLVKENSLIMN